MNKEDQSVASRSGKENRLRKLLNSSFGEETVIAVTYQDNLRPYQTEDTDGCRQKSS